MARMHGGQSEYLIKWEKFFKIASFSWLILGLSIGLYGLVFSIINIWLRNIGIGIGSIMVLALMFALSRKADSDAFIAEKFLRGRKGEAVIWYELRKLPNTYSVFQDVKINDHSGNIDFVVVGPTGIFAIEVKSHKGVIGFNGDKLIKNGYPFEEDKDFIKQSSFEAMSLYEYLGQKNFVTPILAFSSSFARVRFGFKPIKHGVHVIQKRWLLRMIESQDQISYGANTKIIEEAILRKTTHQSS